MQKTIFFTGLLATGVLFSSCVRPASPEELRVELTEDMVDFLEDGDDEELRELLTAERAQLLMKSAIPDDASISSFDSVPVSTLHPLMQAILLPASEQRRIELLRILLAAGADVNMTMGSRESVEIEQADGSSRKTWISSDYTPLHLACTVEEDSDALVKFLIDSGADVKALAHDKRALDLAVLHLKTGAAEHLVRAGADVKKLNLEGFDTPQNIAVHGMKALPMIDFLLKNGFAINKRDDHRATFLHYVGINGGCECHPQTDYSDETRLVIALMQRGANPHLRDDNGLSALDNARASLPRTKELVEAMQKK